jgi:hypothetical protein
MRRVIFTVALALCTAAGFAGTLTRPHPVYPPAETGLRFSHLQHEDTSCDTCHPDVLDQTSPRAAGIPGHDVCSDCHDEADEGSGKSTECARCHRGTPAVSQRPAATLKFSHQLHRGAPESCVTCHLPESEGGPTGMYPRAQRCEQCHASRWEQGSCDTCHPARAEGMLKVELDRGKLVPMGGHGGDDHRAGWQKDHGKAAGLRESRCRACHTVRSCDNCHRGVFRRLQIHPEDWELSHPGAARAGLQDCDKCHRSQSMCLNCHRQTKVAESSPDLSPNLRLHPQGYGMGRHSSDARRNLRSCTACHTEGDCIRCHGATGIGLGNSPHPSGFRKRCGLLKDRNKRPCLKCHPALDLEVKCP